MSHSLDTFSITERWPATNPDAIQLYSLPTPNGVKVSIALEELGLAYESHRIPFGVEGTQHPAFLSLNPNNKIPAIIDPNGPNGAPLALFESGAILVYLAEKAGKLIGANAAERLQVLQWVMFQMGGLGPMTGQLGFFYAFGGKEIEDKRPVERYINEVKRLLNVLNGALDGKDWVAGEYSIADIAIAPWLRAIPEVYKAVDVTGFDSFPNVTAYLERFLARSAVQKGLVTPSWD